jgi:hypothetical protein
MLYTLRKTHEITPESERYVDPLRTIAPPTVAVEAEGELKVSTRVPLITPAV